MRTSLVMLIALALLVFASLSLQMGMIPVPWRALLTDWRPDSTHYYVLMEYRLPRLILAIFVGAALAVSGVLVQGIVRNPLASPDILGVNHAASLTAVSGLLLLPSLPAIFLPLLAFGGGIAALLLLRILADTTQPMRLALTGVALSACWASMTDYLMLSHPQDVNSALLWLTGSLWGRDWTFVKIAVPLLAVFLPLSLRFCHDLDLLALGDARGDAWSGRFARKILRANAGGGDGRNRSSSLWTNQFYWSGGTTHGAQNDRRSPSLAAASFRANWRFAVAGRRSAGANYPSPAGASCRGTDSHHRRTLFCLAACENALNEITYRKSDRQLWYSPGSGRTYARTAVRENYRTTGTKRLRKINSVELLFASAHPNIGYRDARRPAD